MCVPVAGVVMLMVAVVPETLALPTVAPSRLKVMVPVGTTLPNDPPMVAVTCKELPAVGVVVAGLTVSVVAPLATVRVTWVEVELL